MNKFLSDLLAFIKEPATWHFVLALAIYLVGVANPSLKPILDGFASLAVGTGTITYLNK